MLRATALAVGVLACACTPAPQPMAASEASEYLVRFAAGTGEIEVCTPEGRAVLRGAVRAYSSELTHAGVAWPQATQDGLLRGMDAAVIVAYAAGFIEAGDLRGSARQDVQRIALTYWPDLMDLHGAARFACAQAIEVQRAAVRLAQEAERYERLRVRGDAERSARQRRRLAQAEAQLEGLADAVKRRIAEARRR